MIFRMSFACLLACALAVPVTAQTDLQSNQRRARPPAIPAVIVANPGGAQDFFVLRQPQADHEITVRVRPEPGAPTPQDFVWERWDPNGPGYRAALSIEWSATASCASGLRQLRISGPGGTLTQGFDGSRPTINGPALYQSFDEDAVDAICIGWAEEVTEDCGENPQIEPGCEQMRTFVFGPNNPLPGSDLVTVSGTCQTGTLPQSSRAPRLQLTCDLRNF